MPVVDSTIEELYEKYREQGLIDPKRHKVIESLFGEKISQAIMKNLPPNYFTSDDILEEKFKEYKIQQKWEKVKSSPVYRRPTKSELKKINLKSKK